MKALIMVDLQNDFVEGGALAVTGGNEIIPTVNQLQPYYDLRVATQDWHPVDHGSFASNHEGQQPGEVIKLGGLDQVLWPLHCVEDTDGAEFVSNLDRNNLDAVFKKGTDPQIDSYSGFFDNGKRKATGLGEYLKEKQVDEVHVLGLATDYCVKFTALDAAELGFKTSVIADVSRGVNLQPGDVEKALEEMKDNGIGIIGAENVLKG